MGQYFYPIVLDESNKVKSWFLAHDYDTCYEISGIKHNSKVGIKIFEHSYFNNPFLLAVQSLMNNPTRIIWLSDAHPDYQQYKLEKENKVIPQPLSKDWPFLVNLSKKEYIITKKLTQLHPLPLLTCRTLANNNNFNGLRPTSSQLIGRWQADLIKGVDNLSSEIKDFFAKIDADFGELRAIQE